MMKSAEKITKASGYIDVAVIILSSMMILAMVVSVIPAYITKMQLDTFAEELCREAEICGNIGGQTSSREAILNEKMGNNRRPLNGQSLAIFS